MSQHGIHELFVTAHQNKLQPTVSGAIIIKYKEISLQYYYSLYLFFNAHQANSALFAPYYITSAMASLALPKFLKLSLSCHDTQKKKKKVPDTKCASIFSKSLK